MSKVISNAASASAIAHGADKIFSRNGYLYLLHTDNASGAGLYYKKAETPEDMETASSTKLALAAPNSTTGYFYSVKYNPDLDILGIAYCITGSTAIYFVPCTFDNSNNIVLGTEHIPYNPGGNYVAGIVVGYATSGKWGLLIQREWGGSQWIYISSCNSALPTAAGNWHNFGFITYGGAVLGGGISEIGTTSNDKMLFVFYGTQGAGYVIIDGVSQEKGYGLILNPPSVPAAYYTGNGMFGDGNAWNISGGYGQCVTTSDGKIHYAFKGGGVYWTPAANRPRELIYDYDTDTWELNLISADSYNAASIPISIIRDPRDDSLYAVGAYLDGADPKLKVYKKINGVWGPYGKTIVGDVVKINTKIATLALSFDDDYDLNVCWTDLTGAANEIWLADLTIPRAETAQIMTFEDDGLKAAVYISLFTDRRIGFEDGDPPAPDDRRGWWGDDLLENAGDRDGSRLWTLFREKIIDPDTLNSATDIINEALQWLIDDGVAESIDVNVVRLDIYSFGITIYIARPEEFENEKYYFTWNNLENTVSS